MIPPKQLAFAAGIAFAIAFANPILADTVVFDDDFSAEPTYSIFNFNQSDPPEPENNPDDISFAIFDILPTGGNPDEHLQLDHFHDLDRDDTGAPIGGNGDTFVQSFVQNESVTYNPAAEGAFRSVTYSIDYQTSLPEFTSVFFTLSSMGSGSARGFDSPLTDGEWQTYTLTANQDDFSSFDFAGPDDLKFGFGFTSGNIDVFDEPLDFQVLVDNFRVTVSPVPEPSLCSLMGFAGLVVFSRRRRREG